MHMEVLRRSDQVGVRVEPRGSESQLRFGVQKEAALKTTGLIVFAVPFSLPAPTSF